MDLCDKGQYDLMRIIKIFLALILFLLVLWGIIVTTGPMMLVYAIKKNIGEEVKLTNLKISPKLHVSTRRVNFNFNTFGGMNLVGSARAGSLTWSVTGLKPSLVFSLGPSYFEGYGYASQAELKINWDNFIDWSNPRVTLNVSQLTFNRIAHADNLTLEASVSEDLKKISNVRFNASGIDLPESGLSKIKSVVGLIDHLKLTSALTAQTNEVNLKVEKIVGRELNFELKNPVWNLKNNNGKVSIAAAIDQLVMPHIDIELLGLDFEGEYLIQRHTWAEPFKITIAEGAFGALRLGRTDFSMERLDIATNVKLSGLIDSLDLTIGDRFFGEVRNSDFTSDLRIVEKSGKTQIYGLSVLNIPSSPALNLQAKTGTNILTNNILECFGRSCELERLNVDYVVDLAGEELVGQVACSASDCQKKLFNHTIQLNNTINFFEELKRTNIANPLATAYFYVLVTSGEIIGNGHKYDF